MHVYWNSKGQKVVNDRVEKVMTAERKKLLAIENLMLDWLDACEGVPRTDQQGMAMVYSKKIMEEVK